MCKRFINEVEKDVWCSFKSCQSKHLCFAMLALFLEFRTRTGPQDLFFYGLVNVWQNKKENLEFLTETEVSERQHFSVSSLRGKIVFSISKALYSQKQLFKCPPKICVF